MLAQDEEKDLKETRMPQLAQHGLFCDLSPPPSSTDPARSVYLVFPGFLPSAPHRNHLLAPGCISPQTP
jgi:hypothetical protein